MTTIVYDHENKLVAVDSRASKRNGEYNDQASKVKYKGALTFILAGSVCDFDYFVNSFEMYKAVELSVELDCNGVMIRDGKAYHVFIHEGVFNEELLVSNEGFGSGYRFALSAMDFGKTAKEAVEYAMTKDIYTGGEVKVIAL